MVKQRDLDATHPHYDAVALLREEEGRLKADEIFEAEPRDPKVAPIFERRVTTRVETYLKELGLDAKVKVATVECKTLSCFTVLEVDPRDTTAIYDLVNGIMLGDVHSPSFDEATGQVTFVNLFRGDARGEDYDARFMTEAYAPALEFAKAQQKATVP